MTVSSADFYRGMDMRHSLPLDVREQLQCFLYLGGNSTNSTDSEGWDTQDSDEYPDLFCQNFSSVVPVSIRVSGNAAGNHALVWFDTEQQIRRSYEMSGFPLSYATILSISVVVPLVLIAVRLLAIEDLDGCTIDMLDEGMSKLQDAVGGDIRALVIDVFFLMSVAFSIFLWVHALDAFLCRAGAFEIDLI